MNHHASTVVIPPSTSSRSSFIDRLNGSWHERALQLFMIVVLAHWAEHLLQAYQVYVLAWPPSEAGGLLGLWYPWLVKKEALHYGYALVMLVGIWMLLPGFVGRSRSWWMLTLVLQFIHHFEHALLMAQSVLGHNLLDSPVPISVGQIWIRRVELHLIYNTAVFIPMVVAMYYHLFPSEQEACRMRCSCAIQPRGATA